jgi:ketosteroid isomerase-like protein
MSQQNVDLARRGYEALAAGDVERVLELIDPDVSVEVHTGRPDLPERLRGHAGFLENLRGLMEVFEDIEIEPEEFIDLGEDLVVTIFTAGHGRASGIRVENRVVHIWTIRDGKATRFRVFGTRQEALEALGLTEQDLSAH